MIDGGCTVLPLIPISTAHMEAVGVTMSPRSRAVKTPQAFDDDEAAHGDDAPEAERSAAGRLLHRMGLQPRKGLGQHFLVSSGVLERIAEAADVGPNDTVVEVGPGLGALTEVLARRAGEVLALELDDELAEALKGVFADQPHVNILHGDAMKTDLGALVPPFKPYKVVANLPYYVATAIVRRFLEAPHKPSVIVVTVQREVAKSMSAPVGQAGLLGIATQFYGRPQIVSLVRPGSFYPPPKVMSAVLRIDVHPSPPVQVSSEEGFFTLVRAGFSAPRKQLKGVLSHALKAPSADVEGVLNAVGVDTKRRAETLTLEEWAALHRAGEAAGWQL